MFAAIALRKSKVIYARWFDKKEVTLRMLFNIFSCFGNMEKMMFMTNKSSCLIEYQKLESASLAKESLNELVFFKQELKVCFYRVCYSVLECFRNILCWVKVILELTTPES